MFDHQHRGAVDGWLVFGFGSIPNTGSLAIVPFDVYGGKYRPTPPPSPAVSI